MKKNNYFSLLSKIKKKLMKKIYFFLFATMVLMTSATVVNHNAVPSNAASNPIGMFAADGKISKNELSGF